MATDKVARDKTCPLLLRVFVKDGAHHHLRDFDDGKVPEDDELQVYTSSSISSSPWSIGAETMDRGYTNFTAWRQFLGPLGVKRARIQGGWARCEPIPGGDFNFGWLDAIVHGMTAAGVTPWLEFSFGNPAYVGGGDASVSSRFPDMANTTVRAAWVRWVSAVVRRYPAIQEWEVWNEPDVQHLNSTQYASVVNVTAHAVRLLNPGAVIIMNIANSAEYAVDILAALADMGSKMPSSVTYHPYVANPDDTWRSHMPEALLAKLVPFAPGIEVLQGESGAPSRHGGYGALGSEWWSEVSQAKWATRRMVGDWGHGLRFTSLFSMADLCYVVNGAISQNFKGILAVDCATEAVTHPKPAYRAVQSLTALIDSTLRRGGMSWQGNVSLARAFAASGDNPCLLAVWDNSQQPGNSSLADARSGALGLPCSVEDPVGVDAISGAVVELPGCGGGGGPTNCSLPVYDSVVFVVDKSRIVLE